MVQRSRWYHCLTFHWFCSNCVHDSEWIGSHFLRHRIRLRSRIHRLWSPDKSSWAWPQRVNAGSRSGATWCAAVCCWTSPHVCCIGERRDGRDLDVRFLRFCALMLAMHTAISASLNCLHCSQNRTEPHHPSDTDVQKFGCTAARGWPNPSAQRIQPNSPVLVQM